MKPFAKVGLISIALATNPLYADNLSKHIHFDQSQNIFFDQLSDNAFSLSLLQAKSSFISRDLYIGGSTEFDAQYWNGDHISTETAGEHYEDGQGLYFTAASLDLMSNINAWSLVFLSGSYSAIGNNNPDGNTFYLPHAFVLLGNLAKCPLYLTTGINSISFGAFNGSGPWDTPLTAVYFSPTQAPQISLGFYKANLNLTLSEYNDETNSQNHTVINATYDHNFSNTNVSIGAGYLTNFNASDANNAARRQQIAGNRNDANSDFGNIIDFNASLEYQNISLSTEYNLGNKVVSDNINDPKAYAIVLNYTKKIMGEDTTFGVDRSGTSNLKDVPGFLTGNDALSSALAGFKSAWSFAVGRNLCKNVAAGVDIQFANLYQDTSDNQAKHSNTYTLDLTAYL